MFDDQETHYPVPGETPWERLRYLATSTETIYPVPPYVCMKCRRVIVPQEMGAHSARSGRISRLFLAVWHLVLAVRRGRPGEIDRVAVHCAVPAVHARGSAAGLCRHSVGAGYTGRSGRAALCLGDAEERGLSALFPAYASRDRDLYSAIMLPPCPSLDTAIFA